MKSKGLKILFKYSDHTRKLLKVWNWYQLFFPIPWCLHFCCIFFNCAWKEAFYHVWQRREFFANSEIFLRQGDTYLESWFIQPLMHLFRFLGFWNLAMCLPSCICHDRTHIKRFFKCLVLRSLIEFLKCDFSETKYIQL